MNRRRFLSLFPLLQFAGCSEQPKRLERGITYKVKIDPVDSKRVAEVINRNKDSIREMLR